MSEASPPEQALPEERPTPARRLLVQRLRAAPVTSLISFVNIAVFLWAESHGSTTDTGTLLRFGASESHHVWAGEYWRLATPMFLHIGWAHLLWNTYAGFSWCEVAERGLGPRKFLPVYILSGVGGSAASVLVHRVVSAGASGALFGIAGAVLVLRRRSFDDWRSFFDNPGVRGTLTSLAIWAVLGFYLPMDQPAHLGGFAVGVAVAWLLTTERASSLAWTGLAMAYAVLIAAATKPWGFHPNRIEAEALTSYGERYATGRGLPRNEPRAERFLRIACTAGDEEACSDIGRLLNRR